MEENVEANPAFCDADTFRGVAKKFFWRMQRVPCGIRLVPRNGNLADLRRTFDVLFGYVSDGDIFEFRHGSLEQPSHDGSL